MKRILDNKVKNHSVANEIIDELQREWKVFNLTNLKKQLYNQEYLETYWINKPFFNDRDFLEQLDRNINSSFGTTPLIQRETYSILTDYICGNYIETCHTATEFIATVPAFKQSVYDTYIIKANYANRVDFIKYIDEKLFESTIRKSIVYIIKDHLGLYNISLNYKDKVDTIIDMIVCLNLETKTYEEYVNSLKGKLTPKSIQELLNVTKSISKFPISLFEAFSLNIPSHTFKVLFIKNPILEYLIGPSILCNQVIKYSMLISKIISKTGIGIHESVIKKFINKKIEDKIFEVTYENIKKYYL